MSEVSKQSGYQVIDLETGTEFTCSSEHSLLVNMERNNFICVSVGCRGGGCGVCKLQIVSGSYSAKKMSKAHVNDEEITQGIVLACRVFPESDLTIKSVID